jgi:hypothetical protein
LAVKKCEDVDDVDDDFMVRSKCLLQKCAYAMISHQELSAQQVMLYLMDYEDHFASHRFSCLYWASFERVIERGDPEKLLASTGVAGDPVEVDGEEADPDAVDEGGEDHDRPESDATAVAEVEDVDGNEEVSIRVDGEGNVAMLADQVLDYTLRPHEFQSMCLWDFVATTEKRYGGRAGSSGLDVDVEEDNGGGVDDLIDVGDESGQEDKEEVDGEKWHKRQRIKRYWFLPGHEEGGRKHLRVREQDVVSVPIGPALPRQDQPDG